MHSTHPVYKALHKPLTLLWIDRRLFLVCMVAGFAGLQISGSLLYGLLSFAVFHGVTYMLTAHDPSLVKVWFRSMGQRKYYDPIRHEPFQIEVIKKNA